MMDEKMKAAFDAWCVAGEMNDDQRFGAVTAALWVLDYLRSQQEPEVGKLGFVQTVPDHCDRITWRGAYLHLPLTSAPAVPKGWELVPTELGTELYDACSRACSKGYGFGGLDEIMDRIDEAYHSKPLAAAPSPEKENPHD